MNAHEAAKYVENSTSLAEDVHVTADRPNRLTIAGVHTRRDGSTQAVRIEIQDSGPGAGALRYAASVYPETGNNIIGNEAATMTEAISNADVHSSQLG